MEKISLYDLLSILLPGSLFTLFLILIFKELGYNINEPELDQYFSLTIYLSSSIFFGTAINILTRTSLKIHRFFGLYTPIHELYKKHIKGEKIIHYYKKKMQKLPDNMSFKDKIEEVWDDIYFTLESTGNISVPKNFQSFYFFFRNFFTLGIILIIPEIILYCINDLQTKYLIIIGITLLTILISILAASWNRKMMVKRMFWTYYSLYKNA